MDNTKLKRFEISGLKLRWWQTHMKNFEILKRTTTQEYFVEAFISCCYMDNLNAIPIIHDNRPF